MSQRMVRSLLEQSEVSVSNAPLTLEEGRKASKYALSDWTFSFLWARMDQTLAQQERTRRKDWHD